MSNVTMCRVCLASNVQMHVIKNTPLQDFFTKFTDILISQEDGKPVLLCYICYSQLRKCSIFHTRAIKADKFLTQVLENGIAVSQGLSDLNEHTHKLCRSIVEQINIFDDGVQDVSLNEDHRDNAMVKNELMVKAEDDIKEELFKDAGNTDSDNNINNGVSQSDSDSDDNIPLKNISLKNKVKKRKVKVNLRVKKEDKESLTDIARVIILTKNQQFQELRERAKSVNYLNAPLKCELCYKGFIEVGAFENHRDKHDARSGSYECEICRMRYKTARQLRTHGATSHSRQYSCNKCGHRSHTANQAREHKKWHDGFQYVCMLCGQMFRKHTSYLTHKRKSHPTHHVCRLCGHSFVGKHGLLMHLTKTHRIPHDKQPEISSEPASDRHCSTCDIQFLTRDAWQRHVLSARHAGFDDSTKVCCICNAAFPSRAELKPHLREHEKALKANRVTLPNTAVAEMACDQCGANFVNRSKLQAHVNRMHLGLKYNKNIVCEVCGKKCTSNASLKYHQRTHTGERPYQCDTCSKRFSDNNQLRIHTRTHTGERPYCCTICGKRFSQKPALNRHYRVHSGDKPYACQFCSKTFSQSNSLKLHVRTVHFKMAPNSRKKNVNSADTVPTKIEVNLETL